VIEAQRRGQLAPDWEGSDCRTESGTTRVYLGVDGVMVPLVTDEEKQKRRAAVKRSGSAAAGNAARCRRGKSARTSRTKSSRWSRSTTRSNSGATWQAESGNHTAAGHMMERMAAQVGFSQAEEKIGNVDGAPWIRNEIELHGLVDALGLDYYQLGENVNRLTTRAEARPQSSC